MYKEDLALNNLQWLICDKTKPNVSMMVFRLNVNVEDGALLVIDYVTVWGGGGGDEDQSCQFLLLFTQVIFIHCSLTELVATGFEFRVAYIG